jgi:hypothetical protein
MAVNFKDLLSRPVDSAKKPPTKPPGTYTGTIASHKFAESQKQRTPYVRFTFNNIQPGADILNGDQKALLDEEGDPIDFSKWTPYKDFFLTDDALYRLKDFLKSIGIDTSGRSFDETIPEARGRAVLINAVSQTSEDGTKIYTNVGEVTGAE